MNIETVSESGVRKHSIFVFLDDVADRSMI